MLRRLRGRSPRDRHLPCKAYIRARSPAPRGSAKREPWPDLSQTLARLRFRQDERYNSPKSALQHLKTNVTFLEFTVTFLEFSVTFLKLRVTFRPNDYFKTLFLLDVFKFQL